MRSDPNLISAQLNQEAYDAVLEQIDALVEALPFLISLTPTQRESALGIGSGNLPLVREALQILGLAPQIMPGTFDPQEYFNDKRLYDQTEQILSRLMQLIEKIRDTHQALENDLMAGMYQIYGAAIRHGQAEGLDEHVSVMRGIFRQRVRGQNPGDAGGSESEGGSGEGGGE